MMTGSMRLALVPALVCMLAFQYGCVSKVYSLKSQGSLSETSSLSPAKIYGLSELPVGLRDTNMQISGVEIATRLYNERTLRSYDISFVVPIPEKVKEASTIIGQRPFKIILYMRAKESGVIFDPDGSMLYMKGDSMPLFPSKVLTGKEKRLILDCDDNIVSGSVLLFHKNKQTTDAAKLQMTCLQLQFNVATPDPSERFYLKLGKIITSSGGSIQPIIYFSPVNYVDIMH